MSPRHAPTGRSIAYALRVLYWRSTIRSHLLHRMKHTPNRSCVKFSSEKQPAMYLLWCLRFGRQGNIGSSVLEELRAVRGDVMKKAKSFPFERARRITPQEVDAYRAAIEKKLGKKRPLRRGRPPKAPEVKYQPIAIRLHPQVIAWAKREAKKRGVGYQTVINEVLLANIAA